MQHLRPFFQLIKDVFSRLVMLRQLTIEHLFDAHSDILEGCVFPNLDCLNLGIFEGRYTPNFFRRHTNISTLRILTPGWQYDSAGDFGSVYFPRLKYYTGCTAVIPSWLSRSTLLESLRLLFACGHPMTNKAFEALSQTPARVLDLILLDWDLEGCRVVANTFPALKVIRFTNVSRRNGDTAAKASHVRHYAYHAL